MARTAISGDTQRTQWTQVPSRVLIEKVAGGVPAEHREQKPMLLSCSCQLTAYLAAQPQLPKKKENWFLGRVPACVSGFRTAGWEQRKYCECPDHLVPTSDRKQSPLWKAQNCWHWSFSTPPVGCDQRNMIAFSKPFTPSPYETVQSHSASRLIQSTAVLLKTQFCCWNSISPRQKTPPKHKSKTTPWLFLSSRPKYHYRIPGFWTSTPFPA